MLKGKPAALPGRAPSRRTAAVAAAATAAAPRPPPSTPPLPPPPGALRSVAQQREVLQRLEPWVRQELVPRLAAAPAAAWQPSEKLPDPSSPGFLEDLRSIRAASLQLPNDLLVVIAGAAVAAAGAPNALAVFNTAAAVADETGAQAHGWARLARAWAAARTRQGRLLGAAAYLCGRFDCAALQRSGQTLIGGGEAGCGGDAYQLLFHLTLQERARRLLHDNAARLAAYHGAPSLAAALAAAAADGARHEAAFGAAAAAALEMDPDGGLAALAAVAARGVALPGAAMDDGWHGRQGGGGDSSSAASSSSSSGGSSSGGSGGGGSGGGGSGAGQGGTGGAVEAARRPRGTALYRDWCAAAEALGAFTAEDCAAGLEHWLWEWNVSSLPATTEAATAARTALLALPASLRRLGELQLERRLREARRGGARAAAFAWVHKREVSLG
ncbi:hypothetical protein Rsub_04092 [Raphidocelis subcapitata]|uniref:Uncharacterized protein n=1 Tax=Raphidocelis subcapitata TaxID=307507 RepID=A0A2V0NXF1_9CHLO|nr:hypothetical protein Rsub_04092 [Raphidocelis subcapitata]|eukprot:GBF91352.1 hypothetical protein Rsub_04092 [Raphidocelis subcapitata]